MKATRTRWIFKYIAGKGTAMRVGWIYNKHKGVPKDKIRIQIQSISGFWDLNMRLDEALAMICGLAKVLAVEAIADNIGLKKT